MVAADDPVCVAESKVRAEALSTILERIEKGADVVSNH